MAHDDIPYGSEDVQDVYAHLKRQKRFIATKRTAGISTSDIITRIVRDYDTYIRRNLERGYTPRQLNVSFLREKGIRINQLKVAVKERWRKDVEDAIRENWTQSGQELWAMLGKWETKSAEWIREFAGLFSARRRHLNTQFSGNWSIFGPDGELFFSSQDTPTLINSNDPNGKDVANNDAKSSALGGVTEDSWADHDEPQSSLSTRIKNSFTTILNRLSGTSPPPPSAQTDRAQEENGSEE